ncbi:cell division protein FtsQ [Bacteroides sp. 214]|uniref:cell division protein FtsQ/DivIB n=1 Tax=Bacteroides sp. 214 TaxID=2302935 RepID=UPI0013D819E7|nr:cell division protein FtsQ/DivIB [Bacteroides sp. 214]NDW12452.1 cell division protein FtsQ [Bacteroides sp. 214]
MIKRILLLLTMLLLIVYIGIAVTAFNMKPVGQVCEGVELIVRDSVNAGFVTPKEALAILKKHNISPVGSLLDDIKLESLEAVLADHPLIDDVECYKTPSGKIHIAVTQRVPVIRIMNRNGESYYIDNKGAVMPDSRCTAHLPIVTGNVEKAFAMKELYEFALFLQKNEFWNAQIEQVNVLTDKDVELVPRVGSHIIYLGKLSGYEEKLRRLREFYKKGLNKVGWNKYERINLEFSNQIICTKKDK